MTGVAFTTHQLTPKAPPARGFFRRIPAFFRHRLCTFFPRIRPPSIPPPRAPPSLLSFWNPPRPPIMSSHENTLSLSERVRRAPHGGPRRAGDLPGRIYGGGPAHVAAASLGFA